MPRLAWLLAFSVACAASGPVGSKSGAGTTSSWHPSSPADKKPRAVAVDSHATWKQAMTAIRGDACPGAILVWGDLVVEDALEPVAITVSVGGDAVLSGFLLCGQHTEAFLKLQTQNPRLKAGHGGSADLKWRGGQLFLRRRWSAADIALGKLAPPPSDVFQRGETLAAIVSCEDPSAPAADVLAAIARAPKVFLFAMLPLD